jgi:hypothetical protein
MNDGVEVIYNIIYHRSQEGYSSANHPPSLYTSIVGFRLTKVRSIDRWMDVVRLLTRHTLGHGVVEGRWRVDVYVAWDEEL